MGMSRAGDARLDHARCTHGEERIATLKDVSSTLPTTPQQPEMFLAEVWGTAGKRMYHYNRFLASFIFDCLALSVVVSRCRPRVALVGWLE